MPLERILDLKDLYEASQILNEAGFELSTEALEQEAKQDYGVILSDLSKEQ